jgi:hypothetical protein
MSAIAQGCRRRAARVEIDWARSTVRQFERSAGSSISAKTEVDDPVEDVVLVANVSVERHRLHAEPPPDPLHRQRRGAALVGELQRRAQHAVPGERRSLLSRAACHQWSPLSALDAIIAYVIRLCHTLMT